MEAIPIANCSSTLPPLTQRILPSKGLCKSLFGPVDHEEISTILDSELKRDIEEKNDEWCFNFSEGTPLGHGRLVWEKVTHRSDDALSSKSKESDINDRRIPALHDDSEQGGSFISGISQREATKCSAVNNMNSKRPSASSLGTHANKSKVPRILDRKRKRQYRTITDFMKQKKRRRISDLSLTDKGCEVKSNKFTSFNKTKSKDDVRQMIGVKVQVFDKR